jgi:hypothetical protein
VSVVALAAACASPANGDETSGGDGGIGGVVEMVVEAPADASSGACDVERRVVATAVDTYLALTGSPASSEQDLIDEGFLREPSELFDLTVDGTLVPAPAGPCA